MRITSSCAITPNARWYVYVFACLGIVLNVGSAADFNVTSPGFFYSINGMQPNPTLTLIRGETYTFSVSAGPTHPFRINSPPGTTENNNISSGTITFRVPTNAANYTYVCSIHGFGGQILTVPPPTFRIVDLDVGANLVLRATGTNNWTLAPQFSTNLATTNWFALTVQSNRFSNGTNEIFCGRPPGDNVFIRLRAQRN
ncbi:MAG: hypothetical protein L0Y58_04295 [Verrucomicrobia subdivision 3 bacterium]|nr:hypothetical protein [Limisphaerales bacterium]